MKLHINKFIICVLLAILSGACTNYIDEATPEIKPLPITYRTVPVSIEAGKKDEIKEEESEQKEQSAPTHSRIEVGEISGGNVTYKWSERDSIGIFLLNVQPKHVNISAVGTTDAGNPSNASFDFNAEFVDNSDKDTDVESYDSHLDMFIYYPYNSSMVVPQKYTSGSDSGEPWYGHEYLHTKNGLVYRVPALQTMLEHEIGRQGCTKAISRYGFCYDFLRYENNGSSNKFAMRHANAYLRVRVTGSQHNAESTDFGNGEYFLRKIIVRAANTTGEEEVNANIAGTYHMSYDYAANGSAVTGDEELTPLSTGGITHVSTELHTQLPIKQHNNIKDGSEQDAGTYALLTISPHEFVSKGVNKLFFTVELVKHMGANESGITSITRSLSISSDRIQAGGLYDITFNAQEPVNEITKLDAEDTANTYIIRSPGAYIFTADKAGNGVLPYKTSFAELGIAENLIDDSKHYDVDWLWASGPVFEGRSVEDVCEFYYNPADKNILFTLKDGFYNASGNLVLALYEKQGENNNAVKEIVWSWHMWLAEPSHSHFRFANTRAAIALNNEEWHMIDRNLGAETADLSCKAYGCYYQVGRKDPFIGPNTAQFEPGSFNSMGPTWLWWSESWVRIATLQNTAKFGILAEWKANVTDESFSGYNDVETYRHKYPMWLISRDFEHAHLDRNKYAWVHTEGQADFNTKTLFDPCPPGYKLPTTREWDNFKNNEFEYTNPVAYSSGPFGYCLSTEAVASNKAMAMTNGAYDYPETHDAWATLASRREAGDYYEVDEYNGRRYHTVALSAHGDEIITCFPTSGALSETGQYHSVGFNFALWASGRVEPLNGEDYSETRYDAHWFGIKDNWSSDWKESYDTEWDDTGDWRIYCPYLRDDANYSARINLINNPIGTAVYGIGTPAMEIDESGHHSALGKASNYAVPVRCIRQYDSTAGRSK